MTPCAHCNRPDARLLYGREAFCDMKCFWTWMDIEIEKAKQRSEPEPEKLVVPIKKDKQIELIPKNEFKVD